MKKHFLMVFTFLLLLTANIVVGQEDFSKVNVRATIVAGNVYMITGLDDMTAFSGGNIGVCAGKDGVVMVDSKMAPLSDKVKKVIHELGGGNPKYIINTHVHGDHTGGNAAFRKDGTIIAQTNVRKRLMADKPEDLWPVITFDQSLSIHFNGEEIKVMHYPHGHTDGDAVIYFTGSNVVHMGDLYFSGIFPFVDLDNGGSVTGYIDDIKKIIPELKEDVKIIPGHGPLSTLDDLKTNLRMLEETTALVRRKMQSGASLDVIKKEGLQEEWKSWSWFFITTDRWIETIYKSYTKDASKM